MPVPSVQCGPSGGHGGSETYADDLPGDGVRITAISFTFGDPDGVVNTFQTTYSDGTTTPRHGNTPGNHTATIALDPGEYIKEVSRPIWRPGKCDYHSNDPPD